MIESLNAIAHVWWTWIAAMFWQVGLLIVLIACLDRLIRRWAWPQLRYALWSLVLIKLILPPALSLPSGIVPALQPVASQALRAMEREKRADVADRGLLIADPMRRVDIPVMAATPQWTTDGYVRIPQLNSRSGSMKGHPQAPLEAATLVSSADPPSEIEGPRLAWSFHAMVIWLAGSLALGIWLLLRLHALAGQGANRAADASLPQSFYNQMAGCAARLGLRRIPKVIVVKKLATPAVFGLWRPVLLMPKGYLRKLSRKDTEHMLLHELAHIKRGDLHMHGLYMLLQIVHWYNPLLWLVRRQLHHLRELSCDATVAGLLREQTIAYRQTLLETARRFLARSTEPGLGLLGLFEDANRLAVRLRWLERPTWRYTTMKRVTVAALAVLMFVCVLPMAQGQTSTTSEVKNETTDPTQNDAEKAQALEELKVKLEQLELEGQKLRQQLATLEQARAAAGQAKAAAVQAGKEAEKARKEAEKAAAKAKEAEGQAWHDQAEAKEHQQWAKEMQAWAEKMQQWQKAIKQWENSDAFEQWEKDVEQWSQSFARQYEKSHRADADADADADAVAPVLPMPAMPPMPTMPAMPATPAPPDAPHPMPHPVPVVVPTPTPMPMPTPRPHAKVHSDDDKVKAEATMNFTSPLADGGLLIVENRVGGINVRGAATNECRVNVKVTARAKTEEEAQFLAQAVNMKCETTDDRFFIRPVKPDDDEWKNIDVAFEITVPHHVNLQLNAEVGGVFLRSVKGRIKVKTNVGTIATENIRGDIDLEANVGDVQFIAPDGLSAKVTASTSIGSIESDLPIRIQGPGPSGGQGFHISMGSKAAGTLGNGEGTVNLKANVGSISIQSQAAAKKAVKIKKLPTASTAPAVVTTGNASGVVAVAGTSGDRVVTSLETGVSHNDTVTRTVTLDGTPGVRMIESIRETQEGNRHVLRRTESETLHLASGSVINVANEDGTITVSGTDGDTCQVHAMVTVSGPVAETVKKLSKTIWLDITPKDKGLTMAVARPKKMPDEHSYRVDLQILVPRHSNLNVTNEDGHVKITDVVGQTRLALEDGNVLCERLAGELKLTLEDSNLQIDRSTFSDCRIMMEDGDIACNDIRGNLDVQLEDGQAKIVYADQPPEDCTVKVIIDDGNIKFSAPGAMFPADDSARVRRQEDGAKWHTEVRTDQGRRAVTLAVGDGSINVDKR